MVTWSAAEGWSIPTPGLPAVQRARGRPGSAWCISVIPTYWRRLWPRLVARPTRVALVREPGTGPGRHFGRRPAGGDPACNHLGCDRRHEDAGAEMPGGQPGVVEPRELVDDRAAVRVPRPETAPLVGGAQPGQVRQLCVQVRQDGADDLLAHAGTVVAGVQRAARQQPAVLELRGDRGHRAGEPDRRWLGDQQVSLDQAGGKTGGQPLQLWRHPGGEYHRTGMDITGGG